MWPERSITCTRNPDLLSITTSVVLMCCYVVRGSSGEPNCRIMAQQISCVRATLITQVHWSTVLQSPEENIQIDQLAQRLVKYRDLESSFHLLWLNFTSLCDWPAKILPIRVDRGVRNREQLQLLTSLLVMCKNQSILERGYKMVR